MTLTPEGGKMKHYVFSAEETPYLFYGDGKGNLVWECKYCGKKFVSSDRIYQHCRREVYKENALCKQPDSEVDKEMPIPWKMANEELMVLRVIRDLFDRFDEISQGDSYDDSETIRHAVDRVLAKANI